MDLLVVSVLESIFSCLPKSKPKCGNLKRSSRSEMKLWWKGCSAVNFHILNILVLISVTGLFIYFGGGLDAKPHSTSSFQLSLEKYGWFALVLYLCRYLTLLALPQVVFNFFGFILYNPFPETPHKEKIKLLVPFICFRVVTKGDFPELVRSNVQRNVNICLDAGLDNFMVEVVTDKSVNLAVNDLRTRELVVPTEYKTKSGAMFKARALQYCLEDGINTLNDEDWVVHLDEETILTEGSVNGIVNFVCDGRHQFGQGMITYANEEIVNCFLTLCDTLRVAEDMGKIQFQLRVLHMPILGWKGSYVVSQLGAEKKVTFDNGPDSSVAEDTYFGILAASQGFSFNFIQGEMWEKSPFTLIDFLQQRKRWLQGLLLVTHSSKIPLRYRMLLGISVYSWVTIPLTTANLILQPLFPIGMPQFVELAVSFIGGVWMYMYIYGTCRSFSIHRFGLIKFLGFLLTGVVVTPFKVAIEIIAVVWGLLTPKHKFYVVRKDLMQFSV